MLVTRLPAAVAGIVAAILAPVLVVAGLFLPTLLPGVDNWGGDWTVWTGVAVGAALLPLTAVVLAARPDTRELAATVTVGWVLGMIGLVVLLCVYLASVGNWLD